MLPHRFAKPETRHSIIYDFSKIFFKNQLRLFLDTTLFTLILEKENKKE